MAALPMSGIKERKYSKLPEVHSALVYIAKDQIPHLND